MIEEQIVRAEAREFASIYLDNSKRKSDDYIQKVKYELERFYSVEAKMYYIDEAKLYVNEMYAKHLPKCTSPEKCAINRYYDAVLYLLNQEFSILPKVIHKNINHVNAERTTIFISYSHFDKEYLDQLKRHFRPIERFVDLWDDSRITPGKEWKEEIRQSIAKCKVAILLVSTDFFNSDFINNNELPPLLELAENSGVTILTVIVKPCYFEAYSSLSKYQAVNDPKYPISGMDETEREWKWVELVKQIETIVKS